jgi:hypothetical protein
MRPIDWTPAPGLLAQQSRGRLASRCSTALRVTLPLLCANGQRFW